MARCHIAISLEAPRRAERQSGTHGSSTRLDEGLNENLVPHTDRTRPHRLIEISKPIRTSTPATCQRVAGSSTIQLVSLSTASNVTPIYLTKAGTESVHSRWTMIEVFDIRMSPFAQPPSHRTSLPPLCPLLRHTQAPRLLSTRPDGLGLSIVPCCCMHGHGFHPRGQRLWWC